jgi:hypothetical protein
MASDLVLSCPTIRNELLRAVQKTNFKGEVQFLPAHLHSEPKDMNKYLQKTLDGSSGAERIIILVAQCGGSTAGLRATAAELVIPRCADCIDILLSGRDAERPHSGLFVTESWAQRMKGSEIDAERLMRRFGRDEGAARLRKIYRMIDKIYIADTGAYDMEGVERYLAPLVEATGLEVEIIPAPCAILTKLLAGQTDGDCIVVPKGGTVKSSDFCVK